MAQPWLTAPTLRLAPVPSRPAPPDPAPGLPSDPPGAPATGATGAARPVTLAQVRDVAVSPVTALVVMLLGLALLFVWPVAGLPFVALVVLPTVVYHLRAEQRVRLRRR